MSEIKANLVLGSASLSLQLPKVTVTYGKEPSTGCFELRITASALHSSFTSSLHDIIHGLKLSLPTTEAMLAELEALTQQTVTTEK